jgi:hypothetical protein
VELEHPVSGAQMANVRLSKALCTVVGEVLASTESHATLDALFRSAGAPGDAPALPHHSKWKEWLFRAGRDPEVDSLAVLGNVLEEFMDVPPKAGTPEFDAWKDKRARVDAALEENGLRYFRFGRVLPQGRPSDASETSAAKPPAASPETPGEIEALLQIVLRNLRRSMQPLTHRRKGAQPLSFSSYYDVQDLLHAMLRPWVDDIRPVEFTPGYAGNNTRMDFLLPAHSLVIDLKLVRDRVHAKRIGDELTVDIEYYRQQPECRTLWCVVYDPQKLLVNGEDLRTGLESRHTSANGDLLTKVLVL